MNPIAHIPCQHLGPAEKVIANELEPGTAAVFPCRLLGHATLRPTFQQNPLPVCLTCSSYSPKAGYVLPPTNNEPRPAPSVPVRMEPTDIPCVHRGPQVSAAQCRPCSGQTFDVVIYSCAERARCTITRYKPGQKEVCCLTCPDRKPPEAGPDPFSEIFS